MKYVFYTDVPSERAEEGVNRKILAYSDTMMMVEVSFEKGARGTPHSHPHEQLTYIVQGSFRFTNDGETREVGPGDSIHFAPGVRHEAECLEAGYVIDVFSPMREDFL